MSDTGLAATVGGVLEMHYSQPILGPIYPIRLAVTLFDTTPSGVSNDYLYTGSGAFTPTESGVIATFTHIGACWAPYYPPTWQLSLARVYRNDNGGIAPLPLVPAAAPITGTGSAGDTPDTVVKRFLAFYSSRLNRWRVWLRQLPADHAGETLTVTATAGGYDSRDRAWYSYLSGGSSAICGRDGYPILHTGQVRAWWDTPPAPYVVSG